MLIRRLFSLAVLGLGSIAASAVITPAAFADTFQVSLLGPGVQSSAASSSVNNFTGFSGTTNFNGSSITGTYSGNYLLKNADTYGGAGGTGQYMAILFGDSVDISLSSSANYFGLWLSAVDPGNTVSFYNDSTLLFTFSPLDYSGLINSCPSSYCGNPNSNFLDQNSLQTYLYFNFYDSTGSFNRIVLSETGQGTFESDNQTIGNLESDPAGTPLSPVPEPSTFVLGLSGLAGMVGARHRIMARLRRSA